MNNEKEIKYFINNTLGCKCGDEVFNTIVLAHNRTNVDGVKVTYQLEIGCRLLIYVIDSKDVTEPLSQLDALFNKGKLERDGKGFNRFRLVITSETDDYENTIAPFFNHLTCLDEKMHIHVVSSKTLPKLE
ncbi:MAG: hypothetical protein ACLQVJ_10150 [Syntrophobacteraceae bacterium]